MTTPLEGQELAPIEGEVMEMAPPTASNLFRTDDPAQVLARAQATAEALMPVVRKQGLIANISGKEHLTVEAWQTLGAMLGVTAVCEWTRQVEEGWEARVEARTLDGRVIGAAEAECLRSESTWKDRDDFTLRSMAQTRATSKALASVLRFVATLAGFQGTPAEEMPRDGNGSAPKPSVKQLVFMEKLLREAKASPERIPNVRAFAAENLTGGREGTMSEALNGLKDESTRKATALNLWEQTQEWMRTQSDVPFDDTGLPPEGERDVDSLPF